MADLEQGFQKAAEDIKNLKERPGDEELLIIYGFYKQATVGDCDQPKPGMFQMKDRAKYDYWMKHKGMSQNEARQAYIDKAKALVGTYGLK